MLSIRNINTHYGNIHALKGISLEVKQGEIVTLIGSNGAGKSTTLGSITGLLKATSGEVWFKGQNITNASPSEIVKMGISLSPEGREVFPALTVEENLQLGAFTRKDKKGIKESYERVYELFPRLFERKKQTAGTLSGGEQQMLAIGRALMSSPQLLLLDEPSLGLAPNLVLMIFELIQSINKQGTTVLLVEQNANMALSIANRGYVLETGKVTLSDDAKALSNNESVRKAYLGHI
ncbi:MAG: ABC transporter ATP-binding protein [Clostridia bacterium]|nr:ABC transporter ATP-binding protein [Clostridia bacterium]